MPKLDPHENFYFTYNQYFSYPIQAPWRMSLSLLFSLSTKVMMSSCFSDVISCVGHTFLSLPSVLVSSTKVSRSDRIQNIMTAHSRPSWSNWLISSSVTRKSTNNVQCISLHALILKVNIATTETRGPQVLMVNWVSEPLPWLLARTVIFAFIFLSCLNILVMIMQSWLHVQI